MDQMFVRGKEAENKEAMLVRNQQRPAFDLIESLVEQETWRRLSGHETFIEASTSVPKDVAKLWTFIREEAEFRCIDSPRKISSILR
jgi:hypothetical protein